MVEDALQCGKYHIYDASVAKVTFMIKKVEVQDMEEKKTIDRRTRKTKKAIRYAFADLLSQKDLNDITIRDDCRLSAVV